MKSTDDVNLDTVVSAAGPHIFSFLPLGSLLNGLRSPALVSKSFHDHVYTSIGEREVLDFSQCAHLRKITDDSLSALVMKVARLASSLRPGMDTLEHPENYSLLKVRHLDVSSCRKIQGDCLQTCLKIMPGVKRLYLASCSKFDPFKEGPPSWISTDIDHLQYLDVSCCTKLNGPQLKTFFNDLGDTTSYKRISHLNLSGVSATFDDDAVISIIKYLPALEALDLSGAKKLTSFSFGFVTWFRRSTLKKLNFTGCTKLNDLWVLLNIEGWNIRNLLDSITDPQRAIPPNMAEGRNPLVGSSQYFHELRSAMNEMLDFRTHDDHNISSRLVNRIKSATLPTGCYSQESKVGWFGMLEDLSIDMFGGGYKNQGCIATIAWLNGGRLRKFKASSVAPVSIYDVLVLLRLCRGLQVLDLSNLNVAHHFDGPGLPQLRWGSQLRELDLSCSRNIVQGGDVSFLRSLFNLRSLKLNCLEFGEDGLHYYLSETTSLLRLCIWNCSTVKCSKLSTAIAGNDHLKLLDLDAREIYMDCPLSQLRQACSSLLMLNNKKTAAGLTRIREHIQSERWRIGSRDLVISPTAGHKHSRENDEHRQTSHFEQTQSSSKLDVCTLLSTAFSIKPDTQQQFFICVTCSINFGRVICSTCVKKCHAKHETMSTGYTSGYCDCSILSECQCLEL